MPIAQKIILRKEKTLTQLYKGYKTHREEANRPFASFVMYKQILNYEFNLEFFKPKKDQCHILETHKNFTEKEKKKKN